MLIPVTEVLHEVVEDLGVHVLAELHQNEPVAEPESVHHDRDINTAGTFSAAAEDKKAAVSEEIILAGLRIQYLWI